MNGVARPAPGEPPRRQSWSLRRLVHEVSGQPIEAFQDPARAPHPYVTFARARTEAEEAEPPVDDAAHPVDRMFPPLTGAIGRAVHGRSSDRAGTSVPRSHAPTSPGAPAAAPEPPPSQRPERVYLHHLLLHLDRLHDAGLRYLLAAVTEELAHRAADGGAAPKSGTEREAGR